MYMDILLLPLELLDKRLPLDLLLDLLSGCRHLRDLKGVPAKGDATSRAAAWEKLYVEVHKLNFVCIKANLLLKIRKGSYGQELSEAQLLLNMIKYNFMIKSETDKTKLIYFNGRANRFIRHKLFNKNINIGFVKNKKISINFRPRGNSSHLHCFQSFNRKHVNLSICCIDFWALFYDLRGIYDIYIYR